MEFKYQIQKLPNLKEYIYLIFPFEFLIEYWAQ